MWNNARILLGVCGGIACYKAITLASLLTKQGALVDVIMTESAKQFVTPLTFQSITRRAVYSDAFDERNPSVVQHIHLADEADLILIAPATANVIGKYANGIADDLLTTTLLACRAPIMISPAMNGHMLAHPSVQDNLQKLASRGVCILDPASGMLACGYEGKGRLPEPEQVADALWEFWQQQQAVERLPDWTGMRVWITAGGTREPIDPVRYIGNSSSGKMGFALAEAARARGAQVTLIAGNVSLATPEGVLRVDCETAAEMHQLVMMNLSKMDVLIKSAAVADYRPLEQANQKIKKNSDSLTITLVKNPDILFEVGQQSDELRPFLVGFAAETENLVEHAKSKLLRKNCDVLIANQVTISGAGFGSDQNQVIAFAKDGSEKSFGLTAKKKLAGELLDWMFPFIGSKGGGLK